MSEFNRLMFSPNNKANGLLAPLIPEIKLNIFTSHAWKYGEHRSSLHDLLSPKLIKNSDYQDHSIPREHPVEGTLGEAELYDLINDRIKQCDVLLVFTSMYNVRRYWVENEIKIARAHKVPIISIARNGQQRHCRLINEYATIENVGWRALSVLKAILEVLPKAKQKAFIQKLVDKDKLHLSIPQGTVSTPPSSLGNAFAHFRAPNLMD